MSCQHSATRPPTPAPPPPMDEQPHAITFFTTHAERQAVLAVLNRILNSPSSAPPAPTSINRTRALLIALGLEPRATTEHALKGKGNQ